LERANDGVDQTRLYLRLYPAPTAADVIELQLWTPAPVLLQDGTTDDVNILIPDRPVFQLALMYALNERGEEIGEPGNLAEQRWLSALAVAREKDIASAQRGDRYDWRRD
ncbi:MAG: hypothetical protein ACRDL7_09330, partial [Gaiellaceae bacterium]